MEVKKVFSEVFMQNQIFPFTYVPEKNI
jgi:hypothetical protein